MLLSTYKSNDLFDIENVQSIMALTFIVIQDSCNPYDEMTRCKYEGAPILIEF